MKQVIQTVSRNGISVEVTIDTDVMDRMYAKAPTIAAQLVQKAGFDIERESKRIAPVLTGTMANSIRAEQAVMTPTGAYDDIGPHVDYAYWVEMGHMMRNGVFLPGVHFMQKALDKIKAQFEKAMQNFARTLPHG